MKNFKHLDTITALFVAVLLISNIASTKILDLGWFTFDGGTLLFPLSYIFGDILTEVYGYKRSRKVIWLGFMSAVIMSFTLFVIGELPAAADWPFQESYNNILGATWRIVAGSLLAFTIGEFSNAYVMAKMKIWMKGKYLWMRTIGSTIIGEALDTIIFTLVAFYGIFDNSLLIDIIISNYIFKTAMEAAFTPVTYWIIGWLKKSEGEDYYDNKTDFNPFTIN